MAHRKTIAMAGASALVLAGLAPGLVSAHSRTKTLTFSVYDAYFQKPPTGTPAQRAWTSMMEKYLGVKLNIHWQYVPWTEYGTKQPTYLSSGNLQDVSLLTNNTDIINAGQEGAIVNLMPYLKRGDLPYYKKYLMQNGNLSKVETKGALYFFADGLAANKYIQYGTQWAWLFRFDIFKKNHLPIPSSMQQLFTEGVKLKKIYPHSYMLGSWWAGLGQWYSIDTVFDVMNHTYPGFYFNGSRYVYGPTSNYAAFKRTTEWLHKMYAAGLIDPNFLTLQTSQFASEADKNQFFVVPNNFAEVLNNVQGSNLNVKGFSGQWGTAAPPKNLSGQISWKMSSVVPGINYPGDGGIVISSRAPNIPQLVKLIDYQYSPQIMDLYNYGIKGVTYTLTKNGQPRFTKRALAVPPGQSPANSKFLNSFPVDPGSNVRVGIQWIPQSRSAENQLYGTIPVEMNGRYFRSTIWHFSSISSGGQASVFPNNLAPVLPLSTQQNNIVANSTTALTDYLSAGLAKFVLGKESFGHWNQFIAGLKKQANIQQVLNIDNAGLKKMETVNHWSYKAVLGK